ncbi:hypothetical protein EIP91_007994 [Steccherinum ochraceum]|uniref:DUF6533 domain-containing protein n=1 Tax=Steccherinum ochraceum TaxID=92696 RepID=A0A4R0R979_9APHY|nr:hypothetical protein EIP91_007994 [Steccherinum ochraceum]
MSDSDSNDPDLQQEILAATNRLLVENYCIVASSALLFFDCAITFTREVKRIWLRRTTGATIVFIFTRYAAVAERITLLTSLFLRTLDNNEQLLTGIAEMYSRTPEVRRDSSYHLPSAHVSVAFTALRLYGIYNEWWPAVLIIGIWISRIAIAIYLQVRYQPIAFGPPLWGCGAAFLPSPDTIRRSVVLAASLVDTTSNSLVLASDFLLLVLTWVKTLGIQRTSTRLGMHAPLSTLLLRDGTIYFAAILFIQVFAIVSSEVGSTFILFDVWVYFAQVFNVIFLCRFMLNLRGIYLAEAPDEPDGSTSYPWSDVHFATAIGNLGAPLDTYAFIPAPRDENTKNDSEDSESSMEVSSNPLMAGLSPRIPDQIEMQNTTDAAPPPAKENRYPKCYPTVPSEGVAVLYIGPHIVYNSRSSGLPVKIWMEDRQSLKFHLHTIPSGVGMRLGTKISRDLGFSEVEFSKRVADTLSHVGSSFVTRGSSWVAAHKL